MEFNANLPVRGTASRRSSIIAASCLIFVSCCGTASADSYLWDGGATGTGNANWSAGNNWSPNGAPTPPGNENATDVFTFTGNVKPTSTNDFANDSNIGITFDTNATTTFNLNGASGRTIDLFAGGVILNSSSFAQNINFNVRARGETNSITSNGGLLTISSMTADTVNTSGTEIAGTLTIGGSGNTTITAGINQEGTAANDTLGLVKTGTGTLTIGGTLNHTGTTSVNQGTLVINANSGVASAASGNITVANGARLQGTGTAGAITTTIQSGGTLVSGLDFNSSVGTAALTFNSGSIFEWDINAAGTFSLTDVEGAVTGSGAVFKILLTDFSNSAVWNMDKSWNLAAIFAPGSGSAANLAALFSSVQSSAQAYGRGFYFSGGNLVWATVPEPTSALAGALLGFGLLRRRRQIAVS